MWRCALAELSDWRSCAEVSTGRHAPEGASVSPGTNATFRALRDPDRRPKLPREPVPDEIASFVRGVSWSEVTTVPKRKSHRGLDLDLSLNAEVNIWKGWKENGGTK